MINSVDVAHALSMKCRYNGHTREHYSVAQHCVAVAFYMWKSGCSVNAVRAGLVHDACEAFIPDMPTPIKECLGGGWFDIENNIDRVVFEAFSVDPLTDEEARFLKEVDKRICINEEREFLNGDPVIRGEPLNMNFYLAWSPKVAAERWLRCLSETVPGSQKGWQVFHDMNLFDSLLGKKR